MKHYLKLETLTRNTQNVSAAVSLILLKYSHFLNMFKTNGQILSLPVITLK